MKLVRKMVATQDELPINRIELSEVGIDNFKTLLNIIRNGKEFTFIPEVKLTLNLPSDRKGAHLSRLVEAATEILSKTDKYSSVEAMTIETLQLLDMKHPFDQGQISLKFDFVLLHLQLPFLKLFRI